MNETKSTPWYARSAAASAVGTAFRSDDAPPAPTVPESTMGRVLAALCGAKVRITRDNRNVEGILAATPFGFEVWDARGDGIRFVLKDAQSLGMSAGDTDVNRLYLYPAAKA